MLPRRKFPREFAMPAVKIGIIGGGSAYMTSMFASLGRCARDGQLAGSEVVLMDIDAGAVELMGRWARMVVARQGLPLEFGVLLHHQAG